MVDTPLINSLGPWPSLSSFARVILRVNASPCKSGVSLCVLRGIRINHSCYFFKDQTGRFFYADLKVRSFSPPSLEVTLGRELGAHTRC